MQKASIGLQPLVWVPPTVVPGNIQKQKAIVTDLPDRKTMRKAGWETYHALDRDLMAPRWRHFGEVICGWGVVFAQCIRLGLSGFYYDLDIGG